MKTAISEKLFQDAEDINNIPAKWNAVLCIQIL
jgi:hypothetical protein